MNAELTPLVQDLHACRKAAQEDTSSPCHAVTQFQCHDLSMGVGLVYPGPADLAGPVEIVVVGINPNWSLPVGATPEQAEPTKNTGKAFFAYQQHILSGAVEAMPQNSTIAYVDLVPCGTPSGEWVQPVISRCRSKFFNETVRILHPRVIVAVGRYASEHLYWFDTPSGKSGLPWAGLRMRHATSESAVIGGHKCKIVFVLQPSSHVSREKRDAAMHSITQAYQEVNA